MSNPFSPSTPVSANLNNASGPDLDAPVVLKFGSSILTHEPEVWAVVREIQRQLARGRRIVAVVSAFYGVTDRLLETSRRIVGAIDGPGLARLLATGEHVSASLVSLALTQAGIDHRLLDARDLRLTARGSAQDAEPVAVERAVLTSAISESRVVLVPGFEAIDLYGRPALLGRGGSDLTAVFLAQQLGCEVRLLKDVGGVFERDPNGRGPRPRRFSSISYIDALSIAGKLVQPKTIEFARDRQVPIWVGPLGADHGTLIGAPTQFEDDVAAQAATEISSDPAPALAGAV